MAADRSDAVASLTAGELVAAAVARLRAAGSPTARLDAELLVGHAFGRDRAWLLAHPEVSLEAGAAVELDAWIARRAAGEPIAYIRGWKEWLSLRVSVDPRVLIPRPETELLAEAVIGEIAARLVRDDAPRDVPIVAWDVGTGSGVVALAVALRFRAALALGRLRLVASDVSPDALELAADNLAAHGVGGLVTMATGDLLDAAGGRLPVPDVVAANLPYVSSVDVDAGSGSLAYEPRTALDGGPDGLDLVRRLIAELPARLAPGGVALLEIGAGQADIVRDLATQLPVRNETATLPDLAGIERVVRIAFP
ncbi:MAG: peptide chain release factor N(5)-glutamine methyltransferase [Chloroflexota bacterium]